MPVWSRGVAFIYIYIYYVKRRYWKQQKYIFSLHTCCSVTALVMCGCTKLHIRVAGCCSTSTLASFSCSSVSHKEKKKSPPVNALHRLCHMLQHVSLSVCSPSWPWSALIVFSGIAIPSIKFLSFSWDAVLLTAPPPSPRTPFTFGGIWRSSLTQ